MNSHVISSAACPDRWLRPLRLDARRWLAAALATGLLVLSIGWGLPAAAQSDPRAEIVELLDSGQAQAALDRVDALLEADPENPELLALRGRALEGVGRTDDAVGSYQRAIAVAPEWGPAYLQLGLLYLDQERISVALSPLQRAAELLPDVPLAQVLAGVALRENGRLDESVAAFDRALALDGSDPNLWLDAAITRQVAGDAAGAARAAEEAHRLAPQRPDVAIARARFLARSGDPELVMRAPAAYRDALALDGIDARPLWNELAETYAGLGMHAEAEGAHREVLALAPSSPIEHMDLAFSLSRQERYEEAVQEYTRALELDPEQGWAYFYRGEALMNLDRQEEAMADLDAAVARLPEQIEPLLAAIRLYGERGEHETADRYLEQAAALQPRNAEVGLAQARSMLRQGRAEEALPVLEALVASVPQMLDARYQLGQALMRAGRAEEGRQVLADYQSMLQEQTATQQEALRGRLEGRGRIHLVRGTVYLAEGRLPEAREQLEAAAELAPEDPEVLRALIDCLERQGDTAAAAAARARLEAISQ